MPTTLTGGIYETPIDLTKHGQPEYYKPEADTFKNRITHQFICVWRSERGAKPILLHSCNLRYWMDDEGNHYEDASYGTKNYQIA